MTPNSVNLIDTIQLLNKEYIANFPYKSVRFIENLSAKESASLLSDQPSSVVVNLWRYIPAGLCEKIFIALPDAMAIDVLFGIDSHIAVALLSRLPEQEFARIIAAFEQTHPEVAAEYNELLAYPDDTAARMMTTNIICFYADTEVKTALQKLRQRSAKAEEIIYIIDEQQSIIGEVRLSELVISSLDSTLGSLLKPVQSTFDALDSKDMVIERFEGHRSSAIPVVDAHKQLIGAIRFFDIYQSTKEDLATDMQTMVGVSKEERALSSSFFAVKKRLPWLQINLLTAFAAAAVVGAFEGLISEITALAILLPVAAGQSGNAGAQALAVTMRGLTLREITTRHLTKIMLKELIAGCLNGIAIAITCSIAVYFWSGSVGLSLVIALAMVSSLAIACTAGAIVPIALKKFGMDPAQSSSIVLTTITDIAGFMSFLGIAMLLSDMLPRG
ncbi:Magnesium transporter MgtE [Pseudoalteromonas holothuriae]|uniref:Magnesium transporter MgtE n=1 Tax=Pseudoalteromonas holothuriae TaxID=2963714 RepID=A0A9W4VVF9_9GAMM|nr:MULTISPECIES: magnesium transporter [unclassified Pseudoalteromonas]CAH9065858.1 Magnesium transporter MgtE [Pseudoalteromonas sp. CIP111951]CAH9066281.1 Magnesium transporter MgtE [Pseudoalteromonas sp. CIP111854]